MFETPDRSPVAPLVALVVASGLLCALGASCAQPQNSKMEDPQDLRQRVAHFHRFMRWEEFSRASKVITPKFRHTFLGRYEEYGDDLDIVDLEVERVDPHDEERRRVQVEQKWFVKPDMRVQDEKYVEIWRKSDEGWMLEDRMTKEKWERRLTGSSTFETSRSRRSSWLRRGPSAATASPGSSS
jgi:MoaA/NifB/PqqE/SkfB family radical SAM enzyme